MVFGSHCTFELVEHPVDRPHAALAGHAHFQRHLHAYLRVIACSMCRRASAKFIYLHHAGLRSRGTSLALYNSK